MGRERRARGGAGKLGAPARRDSDWERALCRGVIRGLASRPPSHRAPTLAGMTAPPPRERWRKLWPKQRPGQWLCSPEARILRRAALGHLKAKPQLEPGENQAGSAMGVVDLKR